MILISPENHVKIPCISIGCFIIIPVEHNGLNNLDLCELLSFLLFYYTLKTFIGSHKVRVILLPDLDKK